MKIAANVVVYIVPLGVDVPLCIKINHPREDKCAIAETCAFEKDMLVGHENQRPGSI